MSEAPSRDSSRPQPTRDPTQLVELCKAVGLAAAGLGIAVGVIMVAKRREAPCEDGTFFPEGTTDFRCFVHPQAWTGGAVILVCVALGALIVLCGVIAASIVTGTEKDAQRPDTETEADQP